MKSILIVGGGLSGCTLARNLAELGYTIHIIEKRDHIAGNCYDFIDKNGILVNKYGAHIFHTNSERVWIFVNRFSEWIPWFHKVIGKIQDKLFPIPVNIETVNMLCDQNIKSEEEMKSYLDSVKINCANITNSEEVVISKIGKQLYDKIFKDYTYKQWAKYPNELEPSVLERIPVRTNHNDLYFSDKFQALPKNGYTEFIKNMCHHTNIKISLNTEYDESMKNNYDFVIYTGPIDLYYLKYNYPKLEYRSINFETEYLDTDYYQTNSVINYPSLDEKYTRIVEYKHFLNQQVPNKTTIVKEYTTDNGEPYYPVPTEKNREIYEMYRKLAIEDEKNGVYFLGRLANYKYYNMDTAIENALLFFDKLIQSLNE
jgi:UDP-galactopyranose mutase